MFRFLVFSTWHLFSVRCLSISFAISLLGHSLSAQSPSGNEAVDFANDIRPILAAHCYACHGPDEASRAADLRLDVRDEAIAHAAIIPNEPALSKLIERILATDEDVMMPPPSNKKPLSEAQKELLRKWIEQGAVYADHWAFTPPTKPSPPKIARVDWSRNAMDHFIASGLEREGIAPSPQTDRATLLRRVSLDLTGLPPSMKELEDFLNDRSNNAYERVVDRLLASKHFAEKMALDWLDLARYADTNGYNNDEDRTMWPWRDWVIDAFDRNMPFDQFAIEQIAGDLLPDATQDQLIATGFLRNQGHNTEGGIIQEEYRVEYVADRVHTVSTVFLGLSMQCARCHDHKYDPISQKEYFQFYAYFNSLDEKQASYSKFLAAEPFIRVPSPEQAAKARALEEQIAALQSRANKIEAEVDARVAQFVSETPESELRARFAQQALYRFPLDRTKGNSLYESIANRAIGSVSGEWNWQSGKIQDAIELRESSRIELGDIAQLASDQPFSISLWFKPSGNATMALLSKMDESQSHRGYDLLWSSGKIEMHLIHDWPGNAIKVSSKQALPPDQWYHLVATYDGSKTAAGVKLYLNSELRELDISHDTLKGTIATEEPFRIGLRQRSLPFQGLIDELQVFGSVLAEENVKQLHALEPIAGFADWIRIPPDQRSEDQQKYIRRFYLDRVDPDYSSLRSDIAAANKEKVAIEEDYAAVMVMRDTNPPRETFILKRGAYDQPTDKVEPQLPAVLLPPDFEPPKDRLALARWLVHEKNPLTARVLVNRWWQNYFGTGLVKTVEDFGLTGDVPSNAALLDYLAFHLIETGWDVKAMQKLIVMSATYQQESRISPELFDRDPENRLLARGPRHRLSAEVIRDNALRISGLLQPRIGGPSVKPYQPDGLWEDVTVERRGKYVADVGEGLYRRSLYTFWKRTCPPPSMMTLDAPNREVCLARRDRTNTPLQALVLLNDPTYIECARLLAEQMIRDGGTDLKARIDAGMRRAVARHATDAEHRILSGILDAATQRFSSDSSKAQSFNTTGATAPDSSIDPVELASWTVVASTLLNLDETISKR
ncbi:DUF1553 domain-containing protein [Pirellulaceae bacterium SH449]